MMAGGRDIMPEDWAVQVQRVVRELRQVHYTLRHEHNDDCAECVTLLWLENNGL